jgi:hypothetical protein
MSTTTQSITPSQNTVSYSTLNTDLQSGGYSSNFKNRIINGAMMIDQRNAGASVTPSNETVTYITDRFYFLRSSSTSPTLQQSTDAPAGFVNSLLFTNSSTTTTPTYAQIVQNIEGLNVADLGWGTANAQPVTLSFRVKSSVTGTYSVALRNSASDRSYVSTYTISAANTWETKTITIVGDTTGTWLTTNGIGIQLVYRIGGSGGTSTLNSWTATGDAFASGSTNIMGTSSATFYITGVMLEKGSTATNYDYRPYGTELALCQRYYYKWLNDSGGSVYPFSMQAYSASNAYGKLFDLPVTMRATPTCSTSGSFNGLNSSGNGTSAFAVTNIAAPTKNTISASDWTGSSGMTAGQALPVLVLNNAFVQVSAEL